jgi:hypothetical protein
MACLSDLEESSSVDSRSDCETYWEDSSEADNRSWEVGIISGDQKKDFRIEVMSRWLKRTRRVNGEKDKGMVCSKTLGTLYISNGFD